jgi:hypothetical protein
MNFHRTQKIFQKIHNLTLRLNSADAVHAATPSVGNATTDCILYLGRLLVRIFLKP